jgi:hypothetical protein
MECDGGWRERIDSSRRRKGQINRKGSRSGLHELENSVGWVVGRSETEDASSADWRSWIEVVKQQS